MDKPELIKNTIELGGIYHQFPGYHNQKYKHIDLIGPFLFD